MATVELELHHYKGPGFTEYNTVEFRDDGSLVFINGNLFCDDWDDCFSGYIFTPEEAKVFLDTIRTDGEDIKETILRLFGGHDRYLPLNRFLEEHKLSHTYTTSSYLLGC